MIADIIFAAALNAPRQFASVPFTQALQQAVERSPDVAQAREHVNENTALLAAARGLAAPSLVTNYVRGPQGGTAGNTITQSLVTVGGQVTVGDYLSYLPAVRQAAFNATQAQFDLMAAQRNERLKASDQYYTALKAAATLRLRAQDASGARAFLNAAQIRYRAGDAPRLDVVRAQVALANAQAAADSARVDLQNAVDALAMETGRRAGDFTSFGSSLEVAMPSLSPEKAVTRALAIRSDLASAQQAVNAETAAVALAQRGAFPAITVTAGYTSGVDSGVNVRGPSVGVNLNLPISHAAASRADAERARLAAARYKEESIRRQIVLEVTGAVRAYDASTRATQAAVRARTAAEQQLRATEIGYRSGGSSSLDVADARRTYVQAALNEINAVYAQAQAAARLQMEMQP